MSTQETNLKAIADAIREKDGTTGPIPASSFPERIRAIQAGSQLPDNVRTITVAADPPEGGTVSGGGVASDGMTVTVNAENESGYKFNAWTSNGVEVGTGESYTFTVTGDVEVVAGFVEKSASRLPEGYTEVEYIQSNGEEYIDTGIKPNSNTPSQTKVTADIQCVVDVSEIQTGIQYYFGAWYSYYNYNTKKTWYSEYQAYRTTAGNYANIQVGASLSSKKIDGLHNNDRITVILDGPNYTASIGENSVSLGSTSSLSSGMPNIYLLTCSGGNTSVKTAAKLFSCQIWDADVLTRDFVPCVNQSDEVGLYDLVNGTFYGNANSTGAFIAGPVV